MIKKKNLIIVTLVLFFILCFVFVVQGETTVSDLDSFNNENIEAINNQNNIDYKLLYQNVKETNNKIISIIQWTFGIVITVLIALIGGNFYQNYRQNKSRMKEIEQEFETKFNEFKNNSFSKIDTKIKEKFQDSENNLKDLFKTFSDSQNKEIENLIDKTNSKLDKIKEEFNTKDKKSKRKIIENKNKIKSLDNEISSKIEKLEKNIMVNVNKIEGDLWLLKEVKNNALRRYINAALLELELDKNIEFRLETIIDLLKEMNSLSSSSLSTLQELLKSIPDIEYGVHKDKLTKLIDKML